MSGYQQLIPYGVAFGSTVIALLLSLQFITLDTQAFFYFAVAVSAWQGGPRAGLLTIILSLLAINYHFMPPAHQIQLTSVDDAFQLVLFTIVSLLITLSKTPLQDSQPKGECLNCQLLMDENTNRLRIALNAAQMGMWDWNLVTGNIIWSPEHEQLFGLPVGTFDGRYETFNARIHPDDREGLNQAVAHSLEERLPYQHEYRVIWTDDSIHWIEGRGQAFYDAAGQPIRMSGTIMNIDERKQIELALQESEEKLRLLIKYTPVSLAMFDREMFYIMASQRWVDNHQYPQTIEEYIGRSHYELYPDIPERRRQVHQRCLAGAVEKCDEDLFIRMNGSPQWMRWEVRPWYTATAEIGGIVIFAEEITNRKQTEIALAESEARLSLAQSASKSGVWDWDLVTNQLVWSPEYYQLYQLDPGVEPTYENWLSCIHPDDREQVIQKTLQALEDPNAELRAEFRILHSGGLHWVSGIGQVLRNEAGEPVRMIGITIDITQQKQIEIELQQLNAELEQRVTERTADLTASTDRLFVALQKQANTEVALRESEERRRLALDLTHIGTWDLHLPSGKAVWDDNTFALLGVSPHESEASYDLWRQQLHPDDLAWAEQEFLHSIKTHTDFIVEYRVVHPDNSVHWIMARARATYDELGQPSRVLGVVLDTSDRKQAEVALAQLASVVESSEEAIISKTLEGIVVSWNASAERLFGYSAEEMIGRSISQILPADRRDEEARILTQLKRGERIQQYETVRQRKNGSLVDIAATISPIKDRAGQVIGISKIARDITEKLTVERMKNEFISIVSHELRTPLTSIRGSLGLLAAGVMDDEPDAMRRMIEIASIETERLVRLVNDVLDLEKLESGRVSLMREWYDAADLMQQSIGVMESIAQENEVQLVMYPLSAKIWVAPDRMMQTLTNLLSNAIKFSYPGGIVTLSAEIKRGAIGENNPASISAVSHILFSVQDQGRGIPADKLESIFGRFQQVDTSDSRDKGGTGLGLAICKSIVQQHEGKIWVESRWAQGSTFFFALPLHI